MTNPFCQSFLPRWSRSRIPTPNAQSADELKVKATVLPLPVSLWAILLALVISFTGEVVAEPLPVMRIQVQPNGSLVTTSAPPADPPRLTIGMPLSSAVWAAPVLPQTNEPSGPPEIPESWMVQRWRVEDGLPQNFIRALHQTRDGYLWVGTASGLARFDGRRFVVFNEQNVPAFQETTPDIRRLIEDRQGRLLVGALRGVVTLDEGGEWRVLGMGSPLDQGRIRDLTTDSSNQVWVGTEHGLRRIMDGTLVSAGIPEALAHNGALAVGIQDETLWYSGNSGLIRWSIGQDETVSWPDAPAAFAAGKTSQTIWMLGLGHVYRADGKELDAIKLLQPLQPPVPFYPSQITVTSNDKTFAAQGPRMRLHEISSGDAVPVRTADGAFVDFIVCVHEDAEGALWCGTRNGGLLRLRRQIAQPLMADEPLAFHHVLSVAEGLHGSIWTGTPSGMVEWSRQQVRVFEYPQDVVGLIGGFSVTSVPSGMVWAAFGGAMIQLGPSTFTLDGQRVDAGTIQMKEGGTVRILFRMRNGLFLVGNRLGIHHHHAPQRIDKQMGLGHDDVRALLEDRSGNLWVGTYGGGISRISGVTIENLRDASYVVTTFTSDQGLSHNRAWCLHEDPDGVLWIGTARGLNRFKDGRFVALTAEHGLFEDVINQLVEDDFGRFWIGCNRGIYRVNRADLNAVADGRLPRVSCVVYGEADGMLSAETNGENQPSACKASNGRLYFSTQRGLVSIDPGRLPPEAPPPPVTIEQILANGDIILGEGAAEAAIGPPVIRSGSSARYRIPAGQAHTLAIRYTAGSLSVPERVRFEHRLVGLNDQWQPGNAERVAYFNHLRPGDYRFEVRAANHQGIWNSTGASLAFTLDPHFWQTPLFYVLCGALVIGCAAALQAYRLRFQKRILLLQQQHALELERARIARDMHDRLGANLSHLALRSSDSAVTQTQVREALAELKDLIWSVNPKNDSLADLADFLADAAQQYLEAAGVGLDLDWPPSFPAADIPGTTRQHVAAAFKEALRNVVQHSRATEVRISLTLPPNRLQIEIADNGCGFDAAGLNSGSNGLRHLRARLEEIGGECHIVSQVGAGTRIRFVIPITAASPSGHEPTVPAAGPR